MKSYSIYSRKIHLWFLLSSVIAMIIAIFLMPSFRPIELSGYTMYDVTLNGESVGTVSSEEEAQSDLIEATHGLEQFLAKEEYQRYSSYLKPSISYRFNGLKIKPVK